MDLAWLKLELTTEGVKILDAIDKNEIGRIYGYYHPADYEQFTDWVRDEKFMVDQILERY